MGRPAKGTVEWVGDRAAPLPTDHWKVRITLKDSRPWIHLDATEPPLTLTQVRREAARLAKRARDIEAERLPPAAAAILDSERVDEYARRWCAARRASGHTSVKTDEARLRKHIFPHIGATPIAAVTREQIEAIVLALDAKAESKAFRWRTGWLAWGLLKKMFADARASKNRLLRVREGDPTEGVRGPDRGSERAKVYLYPSEASALLSCAAVPVRWRRIYALSIYLHTRAGELEALEWGDVDLEHQTVFIHRSVNREASGEARGSLKGTKTDSPRRFRIEPELVPLLRAIERESGGVGRVVKVPPAEDLAATLRLHLGRAGVSRAELFVHDDTRKRISFHDLRATGLTWMAVRGDAPLSIKQRAGHKAFTTTEIYIREAQAIAEGFGAVFGPLPAELLGAPEPVSAVPSELCQVAAPPESILLENRPESEDSRTGLQSDPGHTSVSNRRETFVESASAVHVAADRFAAEAPAVDSEAIRAEPPRATEAPKLTPRAELARALGRAVARCAEAGDDAGVALASEALARLARLPPPPAVGTRSDERTGT